MRKIVALLLAAMLAVPALALAADTTEADLQKQIQELTQELKDLSTRVDKNERHTALDRIEWSGDFRVKADTLHYENLALDSFVSALSTDAFNQLFGLTGTPYALPSGGTVFGLIPTGQVLKYDQDNDVLYTTRLRLGMKAKVWDNVGFTGRLLMYKNWGDSTGVKVLDGFGDVTMDGTDGGNTTGDWVRVERAYFDWHDIGGTNFYLSIGRRPSTYGPPTQYRENEMRGGTPSGHLVDFNFDGITIGYHMQDLTGVEGQTLRFCFGQGYESQLGNGTLSQPHADTRDTNLGGFNFDALNDGTNFLQFTLFEAIDMTDAFKGLAAVPSSFLPSDLNQAIFPNFNIVTRVKATENIGNMTLGGVGFTREEMNGINWFVSVGWDRTDPNGHVSQSGFGGLLTDATPVIKPVLDSNGNPTGDFTITQTGKGSTDSKNGYSVYAGIQVPAPLGKFGLEYNYGSKYWFSFTQAQDDIVGSKLATRGHVGEAYYIFDINPNMFIKIGGIYYDYQYTGSGVPVGAPQKVSDVQDGKAFSMFPVADQVWDGYASLTVKF
jgi:hypothetical protein